MNLLKEFMIDDKCSYLDNLNQSMHYKIIDNCDSLACQELIERGYRRFGKMFFRPLCSTCNECKSIKIDVKNFAYSKSQKRVLKKASSIKTHIQKPTISQEHLDLFKKYHLSMKDKKGWQYHETDAKNYFSSFVDGHSDFGYEVLYFDEDRLIGVDLVDFLEDGISSIYFYYDPDYSKYSLGKLSLLLQIKFAKEMELDWIYLGYYVKECSSLSYKAEYKPYLTLQGRPKEYEEFIYI